MANAQYDPLEAAKSGTVASTDGTVRVIGKDAPPEATPAPVTGKAASSEDPPPIIPPRAQMEKAPRHVLFRLCTVYGIKTAGLKSTKEELIEGLMAKAAELAKAPKPIPLPHDGEQPPPPPERIEIRYETKAVFNGTNITFRRGKILKASHYDARTWAAIKRQVLAAEAGSVIRG